MKTIKEKIEVMQGYEAGKQIQFCRPIDDATEQEWHDVYEPVWNWIECDYRIKPESKEPTYRPYENIGEMLCDYNKRVCRNNNRPKNTMPLVWVKNKNFNCKFLITAFDEPNKLILISGYWESLADLFSGCVYLDGTPCGKLVDDGNN